jgi:peptidoglycan/LPS O-acetylase OafA/YrhL
MSRPHLPVLDGLRGLAIALVLLVHHFNYPPLQPWFHFGFAGVDLFFVLSGFLITGILLDTKGQEGWLRVFYQRRGLRTLPLYYAVLLLFALVAPRFGPTSWFPEYQGYYWTHMSSFLVLQRGFLNPLGHFWSLSLEEQFYLLWPLLVAACRPRTLTWVCVLLLFAGIALRAIWRDPILPYGLLPAHLDGLLGGALLAIGARYGSGNIVAACARLLPVATCLLLLQTILLLYAARPIQPWLHPFTLTLVSFFFTTLLSRMLQRPARLFTGRFLRFLGKYSYGIYVFDSLFIHFSNWAGVYRLSPAARIGSYALLLPLVVATAWASYQGFEKRFLRLKPAYPQREAAREEETIPFP